MLERVRAGEDVVITVDDLWIAATAARHGIPVVPQDDGSAPVPDLAGIEIVRV